MDRLSINRNKGTENVGLWPVNPAGGWADRPVCNLNRGISWSSSRNASAWSVAYLTYESGCFSEGLWWRTYEDQPRELNVNLAHIKWCKDG